MFLNRSNRFTKESIIEKTCSSKISPNPSLPVQRQEKDTKEGEFLPFVKGGKEGFSLPCLYNHGLTNKSL
jgi:hypothetical protein